MDYLPKPYKQTKPVSRLGSPRTSSKPLTGASRIRCSKARKARKAREVPIRADLLESLADLASFHSNERNRPMPGLSRQWVGEAMKRAAIEAKIDPARAHPHACGRNCVLRGIPIPVLQQWLGHQSLTDTQRYVELAGAHHSWVAKL